MTDLRKISSPKNGKKGGRPKSFATLATQRARDFFCKQLDEDLPDIYQALLENALDGDVQAAKELFDRGWGKPTQALTTEDDEGNPIPITFDFIFDASSRKTKTDN